MNWKSTYMTRRSTEHLYLRYLALQCFPVRERRNPPPRRKSCAACIRAKRRCNLAQPTCSRCAHRMVQCVYPSSQPRSSSVVEHPYLPNIDLLPGADSAFDTGAFDFLLDTPDTPSHFNRSPVVMSSTMDERSTGDNVPSLALTPIMPLYPPIVSKPNFHVYHINSPRHQYAIEHLMNAPRQMAHENALPWCHAQLYRDAMPRVMQDAQACSALYAARNHANAAAVRRTIEGRVADLVASFPSAAPETSTTTTTTMGTSSTPTPAATSPLDTLARAHALVLYQIMRIFDGDAAVRAAAEHTMPYLVTAAKALAPVAGEEALPGRPLAGADLEEEEKEGGRLLPLMLPVYPLAGTRAFWEEWIMRESARRTLLLLNILWVLYPLLRSGSPILCDKNAHGGLRFTASAHLWHAEDAVEFALAWGQRKHYMVVNSKCVDILAEAQPDDIDQYGRMWLTATLGVDEVKGWFISKGGRL
ncbi:uncharacterized protein B0H64DRAFT_424156 [Chaetomium fimeti]|uniref:Zn(2)-C6 fungal-type domain-containing protein n=1 Tax=Chaetomium fimeti TaxID=1854472 RepID=A0AAE0LS26_9PEZI|nr:hypothetical protein B0H64DRAFT_424156 [Chaetomium fimeti]